MAVAVAVVVGLTGIQGAGLDAPATIIYDSYRVPTIVAETEHDAIFLQGYLHAKDRLFQMDFQRRLFSGRVSELVGPAALPQDVQLRTLGLRRAADRSLLAQTPEAMAWLQAYADGVNAYLADPSQPLPIEYASLEIDRGGIPPWTPTDTLVMAKGLSFGLSFDLGDIDRTLALLNFLGVCEVLGCNGLQLFNDDLYRTAPFESVVSIPPANPPAAGSEPDVPAEESLPGYMSDPDFAALVQGYRATIAEIPILEQTLASEPSAQGSNWWIVSGARSDSGFPMIANDPHLALDNPATFYEVHLSVAGGINVTGTSFPGTPGVVLGCNDTICWGASVNAIDVTDVYNEVLLPLDPSQPTTPTHTLFGGVPEPLQFIPQLFLFNVIGDGVPNNTLNAGIPATQGGVTLVVPRRNNGPIVNVSFNPASPTPLTGLSVQYVGWSATQEVECLRRFARAGSLQEFKDALQYFDVGSQNWSYADKHGNIAYYTSGELPIREDLQKNFFPAGLQPPSLIRDGTNTNKHEWLPLANPQPNQALSTEILPFTEMPQIENPSAGYILNANNDPIGTTLNNVSWDQFRPGFNGLLYLSSGYATGYRMGRLQRLFNEKLAGGGTLSLADFVEIQGNNQLLDAEVLTPYILQAFANATSSGAPPELAALTADPRLEPAIDRLAAWDFSTPTGIDQGFDPGDNPAAPGPPDQAEIDASVASTIYAAWRSHVVRRVIDTTLASLPVPLDDFAPGSDQAMKALRRFLDNFPINGGVGSSLINFFVVPGVDEPPVARDIILLQSLLAGLDLLASDEMAPAFGNSTDLADYRWGKLHRLVLDHPLGSPLLSIPPAGSLQNVSPQLRGFARAGGMGALDASSHSVRASRLNDFMFGSGPARRMISTMTPDGPEMLEVIPGGESGMPGSPQQVDQLVLWLVNAYKPLPVSLEDVEANADETVTIVCDGGDEPTCRLAPVISCLAPTLDADAQTCTASAACGVVASCLDPGGAMVGLSCDTTGPFGLGASAVNVQCTNGVDAVSTSCPVTVVDQTPPTISFELMPATLWPPNHHLVDVTASVVAEDSCGAASVSLASVGSSELDDADGNGDGSTINDIQGADLGMTDTALSLRAERAGHGDGRVYTVSYSATDAAGNTTTASSAVMVPHDQGGVVDPLDLSLEQTMHGTLARWGEVEEAQHYNVIRSTLGDLRADRSKYSLGPVTCIRGGVQVLDTRGHEDDDVPAPGEAFIYMVEFHDGMSRSSYGTESAAKPRQVFSGDCE
ncbi:MAG TPA: penicillin acylase family protein [Candidatus Polarisedimenticolaceae bacterium]|nr:penicillin acylase family protein [Candidatus Polarisedimenticolaceae bacterium]